MVCDEHHVMQKCGILVRPPEQRTLIEPLGNPVVLADGRHMVGAEVPCVC